MSAPGSSHQLSQGDASLYETGAIRGLQQKVTELETKVASLGMINASLRTEKGGLEDSLLSLSAVIQTKDDDLEKLSSQLSVSQGRVAIAAAAVKDLEKKHKEALQAFAVLKEAFDAQTTDLGRLEMFNTNMKAYMERTPAAPRGQNVPSGSPYPQQTTQMELAPSVAGSFGTPVGYGHSAETRAAGPSSALVSRNPSTSQLAHQPASGLISGQRPMPSFAVAPTSRQVTIRRPDSPAPATLNTDLKGKPPVITPGNMKYLQAFSNVFRGVEKFAKRWVVRLGQSEDQIIPPIPTTVKQESAKYLEASTLAILWSKKNLRYALIVRYIADDLVNNYLALSNIPPFPGNDKLVARIKEIANLTKNRQVPLSSEHRSTLITERAKLIASLDSKSSARTAFIRANANAQAIKIHTRLEKILSEDQQCISDLSGIYAMAGKVFFFIWGNPYDWHFLFPPGGRMAFWNSASSEVENEEIKHKTSAEIKVMDLRVLLSTTPVITQIGYSGQAMVPACVCLATTLLSRDGLRLSLVNQELMDGGAVR